MQHLAYIMLGSNIRPVENTRFAIRMLSEQFKIQSISTTWETKAIGSKAPNFLNTALVLSVQHNPEVLKHEFFRPMEEKLGRIRFADKNAPRTIDIDCLIFDQEILDPAIWEMAHLAIPLSELIPYLNKPGTTLTLSETAQKLLQNNQVIPRADLRFDWR